MADTHVIPYHILKDIIEGCDDERTQALLAFQYAMGNRAGELAKEYRHKKKKKRKMVTVVSDGIRRMIF